MHPKKNQRKSNIIIVGMTGCGKSTVAKLLSRYLGYGVLDLDQWIEKSTQSTVSSIFTERGEQGFRDLETQTLAEISNIHSHVIAVGAGICENQENWEQIKNLGTTVWIEVDIPVIARRFVKEPDELLKRPLLSDLVAEKDMGILQTSICRRLESLYQKRSQCYGESDIILTCNYVTVEDSVRRIKAILESLPTPRSQPPRHETVGYEDEATV